MKLHKALSFSLLAVAILPTMFAGTIESEDNAQPAVNAPPPAPEPEPMVEVQNPAVPVVVAPAAAPTVVVTPAAAPTVVVAQPTAPTVVVTQPTAPTVVQQPQTVAVPESQVYGPTAEESSDPKRLIHAFCQAWKDEDWKKVWYCMEPSFRKKNAFATFKRRFEDDAEMNGGLDDEVINGNPTIKGSSQTFDVTLKFQNAPLARPRKVKATVKTTPDGYRLVDSTILPADLNDM